MCFFSSSSFRLFSITSGQEKKRTKPPSYTIEPKWMIAQAASIFYMLQYFRCNAQAKTLAQFACMYAFAQRFNAVYRTTEFQCHRRRCAPERKSRKNCSRISRFTAGSISSPSHHHHQTRMRWRRFLCVFITKSDRETVNKRKRASHSMHACVISDQWWSAIQLIMHECIAICNLCT